MELVGKVYVNTDRAYVLMYTYGFKTCKPPPKQVILLIMHDMASHIKGKIFKCISKCSSTVI